MKYKIKMVIRKIVDKSLVLKAIYIKISQVKTYLFQSISDEVYVRKLYEENTGKILNINPPNTFNEWLVWLNLNDRNPLYTKLADKYEVRDYVSQKIGESYLKPLLGLYNSVDEISFEKLPKNYVIKCTHDCGSTIINTEAKPLNKKFIKSKLKNALKKNYYYVTRNWCYKNIKPRILCETVIETKDGKPPRDYKFFCFNGEPKFLFVASDRDFDTKFDFFDMQWNKLPVSQHYPNSEYDIQKPNKFTEMVECARKLSENIPHVRVDLYLDANNNIFFGELTFCHFSGSERFEPDEFDKYFGQFFKFEGKLKPIMDSIQQIE
ncbi:ATP-grasp fold amidoligase family protein [Actinomycetota bacterium]